MATLIRERPATARRALIVEDQSEISNLLAQIIQPLGFQTYLAGNGAEAVRMAAEISPHLMTLDLNLPLKDGHGVLHDLAANSLTSKIPVIVISAYLGRLCRTSQVVEVLQKPFNICDLQDSVTRAVHFK